MKRVLVAAIILLELCQSGINARAEGALKAVTVRKSSLILSPRILPAREQDPNMISVFEIPSGTEVQLLERDAEINGELLKVSLPDGSIGFMSALAFTTPILRVTDSTPLKVKGKQIPKGTYKVSEGTWKYHDSQKNGLHACPQNVFLTSGKGTTVGMPYPDISDVNAWNLWMFCTVESKYDYGEFKSVLDAIPAPPDKKKDVRLRYKPEKTDLRNYVGFDKEYIEKVFGKPYAYVGPALSEYKGLTYALYRTVMWKVDKQRMNAGIVVFYDSDLIVRDILQAPFEWELSEFKADAAPIFFPRMDLHEIDSVKLRKGDFHKYRSSFSTPVPAVSKPHILDRIRIGSMYFIERDLGVHSILLIFLIILIIEILYGLLVTVWIRFILNYGSNTWAEWRCILLMIPAFAYCSLYVSRFPLIIAVLFIAALFAAMFDPIWILSDTIHYRRCPQCHKYLTPEILETKEGKYSGGDLTRTGRRERIENYSDTSGTSTDRVTYTLETTRYQTEMAVTQEMFYKVRCQECGHVWDQKKNEKRPSVLGPILVERIETVFKEWLEVTVEKQVDRTTGEEIPGTRSETSRWKSSKDVDKKWCDDRPRYRPYFHAYLNGNKGALRQYYEDCWDSATYDFLCHNAKKEN